MGASLAAVSALGALLTIASPARGDSDSQIRLVWVLGERTEGCGDGATIARRVAERLGRDVFSDTARRSIEGVIQHEGEHWDVHLYVRAADGSLAGSRYLTSTSADCAALDAAVTLAVALVIDPDAASRTASQRERTRPASLTPSPPPAGAAAAAPVSPPAGFAAVAAPTVSVARPTASPTTPNVPAISPGSSLSVTARALVAAGVLPAAAAGAAFSAEGPSGRPVEGSAGVVYWPEVRTSSREFAFGLTAGWLGACARPWQAFRATVSLCGKVYVGAIHSVVYALEPTEPGDRIWTGAALSLAARLRLVGPLVAELGGEMLVPVTRQRFKVQGPSGSALVFQEWAAAGLGFVGVGVSIP
ncbi:MAG: hypothetical protein ABSF69_02680 [Polyangiaceae bacterium]|jgi:hypothetical protein